MPGSNRMGSEEPRPAWRQEGEKGKNDAIHWSWTVRPRPSAALVWETAYGLASVCNRSRYAPPVQRFWMHSDEESFTAIASSAGVARKAPCRLVCTPLECPVVHGLALGSKLLPDACILHGSHCISF